jgi:hypothetical protein
MKGDIMALHVESFVCRSYSSFVKARLSRNSGPKKRQSTTEGGRGGGGKEEAKGEEVDLWYDYICNNRPIVSAMIQHHKYKHKNPHFMIRCSMFPYPVYKHRFSA